MIYGLFPVSFSPFTLGCEGFSIAQKVPCTEMLPSCILIISMRIRQNVIYLVI